MPAADWLNECVIPLDPDDRPAWQYDVRVPKHRPFIRDLKATVGRRSRKWDRRRGVWSIKGEQYDAVCELISIHFNQCIECGEVKPRIAKFFRPDNQGPRLRNHCRPCEATLKREYNAAKRSAGVERNGDEIIDVAPDESSESPTVQYRRIVSIVEILSPFVAMCETHPAMASTQSGFMALQAMALEEAGCNLAKINEQTLRTFRILQRAAHPDGKHTENDAGAKDQIRQRDAALAIHRALRGTGIDPPGTLQACMEIARLEATEYAIAIDALRIRIENADGSEAKESRAIVGLIVELILNRHLGPAKYIPEDRKGEWLELSAKKRNDLRKTGETTTETHTFGSLWASAVELGFLPAVRYIRPDERYAMVHEFLSEKKGGAAVVVGTSAPNGTVPTMSAQLHLADIEKPVEYGAVSGECVHQTDDGKFYFRPIAIESVPSLKRDVQTEYPDMGMFPYADSIRISQNDVDKVMRRLAPFAVTNMPHFYYAGGNEVYQRVKYPNTPAQEITHA